MSNIKVLAQYIKDLSFEVPKGADAFLSAATKPNIELSVDIDVKKISTEIYEVSLKLTANAKTDNENIFLCEVAYCGIFSLQKIEEDMVEQILLIYCPNLLFPFIRRIIANLTIDSGFPPLMIDPIDFTNLYNKRKSAN